MSGSSYNYSGASAATPQTSVNLSAVKTTQTEELLHRCNLLQSTTHDLIETLENKLRMVLSSTNSALEKSEPSPGYSVELHGRLQSCIDHASGINARLSSLIDRVSI